MSRLVSPQGDEAEETNPLQDLTVCVYLHKPLWCAANFWEEKKKKIKNLKLDQKFCFWLVQIFLFSLQPKELHYSLVMSLINANENLMNPEKIPTVVTHHR